MSKAFEDLIAEQAVKLEETSEAIDDEVNEKVLASEDEVLYPENVFAHMVIDHLAEAAVISIPQDQQSDEHFFEHAFRGNIGRHKVDIWGSALFRCAGSEGLYELHLFGSDYKARDGFEEMTGENYKSMYDQMFRFYTNAKSGKLQEKMSSSHPSYKVAQRIGYLAEAGKIVSIRSWMLTNRVFAGKQKHGRVVFDGVECTSSIVDLKYLADLRGGKVEINQDFTNIGGVEGVMLPAHDDQDYDCILSWVSGSILSQLYSNHGTAIVAANVRAYLGDRGRINAGILETIENAPSRFLAYNNGLVISADHADYRDGKLYALEGIQIINGGQTTASIYNAWLRARNSKKLGRISEEQILENLAKLRVPMKIVVSRKSMTDDDRAQFRQMISSTANSQNAVKRSDLSANDPFQMAFGDVVNKMRTPENDCWFYERARGLYQAELMRIKGNRVAVNNFNALYPKAKLFAKDDLALAYVAWSGDARTCAAGKEKAFSVFCEAVREDPFFEFDPYTKYEISKEKAQALISQWILFKALQKAVTRSKTNPIKNPRIAVVYTIALLGKRYGDDMHWDRIWSRQEPSAELMNKLVDMAYDVDAIIRRNLGNFMISMFGRQAKCQEVLDREFSFDGRDFESVYELRD